MAKPNANKELINMLKKMLNEKQADNLDPVADSTLLEGFPDLMPAWFDLFGFISDVDSLPVDAAFMDQEKAAVQADMSAVLEIAEFMKQMLGEFKDSSAPKDMPAIADFIFNNIKPAMEDNDVDLGVLSQSAYVQLIIGAVKGTVNAERPEDNEPGCDLDGAARDAVPCAMNKMMLTQVASFLTMLKAYEELSERIEGRPFLRRCDQLDRFLDGPKDDSGSREAPGDGPNGDKLVEEFAATVACVKANIEATRDYFKGPEEAAEERRLAPLPAIIRRASLLELVQGHIYFVQDLIRRVTEVVVGPEAAADEEKKMKERMETNEKLRLFHAKAQAHKKHFYN